MCLENDSLLTEFFSQNHLKRDAIPFDLSPSDRSDSSFDSDASTVTLKSSKPLSCLSEVLLFFSVKVWGKISIYFLLQKETPL